MLATKATLATNQILGLLELPNPSCYFTVTQSVILELLTSTYLQGRKDQIHRVQFKQLPGGSLEFTNKVT